MKIGDLREASRTFTTEVVSWTSTVRPRPQRVRTSFTVFTGTLIYLISSSREATKPLRYLLSRLQTPPVNVIYGISCQRSRPEVCSVSFQNSTSVTICQPASSLQNRRENKLKCLMESSCALLPGRHYFRSVLHQSGSSPSINMVPLRPLIGDTCCP